jgi:hypothetical protein
MEEARSIPHYFTLPSPAHTALRSQRIHSIPPFLAPALMVLPGKPTNRRRDDIPGFRPRHKIFAGFRSRE